MFDSTGLLLSLIQIQGRFLYINATNYTSYTPESFNKIYPSSSPSSIDTGDVLIAYDDHFNVITSESNADLVNPFLSSLAVWVYYPCHLNLATQFSMQILSFIYLYSSHCPNTYLNIYSNSPNYFCIAICLPSTSAQTS